MSRLRSPDGHINRIELNRQLERVSSRKTILEMVVCIPFLALCCLISAPLLILLESVKVILPQPVMNALGMLIALAFIFGAPLLLSALVTRFYCRPAVRCPGCDASLWNCRKFNFKAFGLQVRPEITACPNCSLPIIEPEGYSLEE